MRRKSRAQTENDRKRGGPLALDHRARVEGFRRKNRTGQVTLVFTDSVDSIALRRQLGIRPARAFCKRTGNSAGKPARLANAEEIAMAGGFAAGHV